VDTDMTARVRSVLPTLEHRRPDIYSGAAEFSGAGEAIRA